VSTKKRKKNTRRPAVRAGKRVRKGLFALLLKAIRAVKKARATSKASAAGGAGRNTHRPASRPVATGSRPPVPPQRQGQPQGQQSGQGRGDWEGFQASRPDLFDIDQPPTGQQEPGDPEAVDQQDDGVTSGPDAEQDVDQDITAGTESSDMGSDSLGEGSS
jgi:hypothetical protein